MNTITFPFTLRDALGNLVDPTTLLLRDNANTYGIRNAVTLAVHVAAGTTAGIVHDSLGKYHYTFEAPDETAKYQIAWEFDPPDPSGPNWVYAIRGLDVLTWYYADIDDVEDLIGARNLADLSNMDPTQQPGETDENRVLRGGLWSDSEINLVLRGGSYKTPLTGMDADTARTMADISARLTAWWLYSSRGIREADQQTGEGAIGGVFQNHYNFAMSQLKAIASGNIIIGADVNPIDPTVTQAGVFRMVPIKRGCTAIADENTRPLHWHWSV